MAVLRILQYPDPRLRIKAVPVENPMDAAIQGLIDDMFETLYKTPNCAGLSATQLDLDMEVLPRITVIDESASNMQPICLINPVIVSREGSGSYAEGCMSIYPEEIHGEVRRSEKITFTALNRNGEPLEIAANGFFAICVQHEVDHLDGILFIDHLSFLKRKRIDKKILKLQRKKS